MEEDQDRILFEIKRGTIQKSVEMLISILKSSNNENVLIGLETIYSVILGRTQVAWTRRLKFESNLKNFVPYVNDYFFNDNTSVRKVCERLIDRIGARNPGAFEDTLENVVRLMQEGKGREREWADSIVRAIAWNLPARIRKINRDDAVSVLEGLAKGGEHLFLAKSASMKRKQIHYEQALELFNKASQIFPNESSIISKMGEVLRKLGRKEEAIRMDEKYINLTPIDVSKFYEGIYVDIEIDPDSQKIDMDVERIPIATDQSEIKKKNEGIVLYRKARIQYDPKIALKYYDKALELNPYYETYPPYWSFRGDILSNLGRHAEALGCYNRRRSLESLEPSFSSLHGKALSLMALSRYEEASAVLEEIITTIPSKRYISDTIKCYNAILLNDPTNATVLLKKENIMKRL